MDIYFFNLQLRKIHKRLIKRLFVVSQKTMRPGILKLNTAKAQTQTDTCYFDTYILYIQKTKTEQLPPKKPSFHDLYYFQILTK